MHLKLRHLEVFDALMEAGSISHAAQKLNVTQPAVSVALSNFEKELGFLLFHRSKGYFAPTTEAQLLHGDVEQGMLALSRVERRAVEIKAGLVGGVTVASNGVMAINVLPTMIAQFLEEHPRISVDLRMRSSRPIANMVSVNQADIGLIDGPAPVAGLTTEVFRLPCVCILREDDPLAAEPVIRPTMLGGRSVVAITGDHQIDRQLDGMMSGHNLTAERRVSATYFAITRNLVRAGAGVAVIDPLNGKADLGDGVIWRPFQPRIAFEFSIITPRDVEMRSPVRVFHDRLRARLNAAL